MASSIIKGDKIVADATLLIVFSRTFTWRLWIATLIIKLAGLVAPIKLISSVDKE